MPNHIEMVSSKIFKIWDCHFNSIPINLKNYSVVNLLDLDPDDEDEDEVDDNDTTLDDEDEGLISRYPSCLSLVLV